MFSAPVSSVSVVDGEVLLVYWKLQNMSTLVMVLVGCHCIAFDVVLHDSYMRAQDERYPSLVHEVLRL